MALGDEYVRSEIMEVIIYIFMSIIFSILIPLYLGFVLLGFEESFVEEAPLIFGSFLVNFIIYLPFIIVSLFLIIFPIASLVTIKKGQHPATQPNAGFSRFFSVSFIFEPQNGALYRLFEGTGLKGNSNPMRFFNGLTGFFRIFAYSIIIFGALGIAQILLPQLQVVGIPQLQVQQITVTNTVLFTAFVPGWSETMTILFVLFFLCGVLAFFTSKLNDKKLAMLLFFLIALTGVSLVIALVWAGIHNVVYGNSEAALLATLIFGYIGSVLTIITGTFIPFFVWHVMNNLFAVLAKLVSINEDIVFIAAILEGFWIFIVVSIEVFAFRRRRRLGITSGNKGF